MSRARWIVALGLVGLLAYLRPTSIAHAESAPDEQTTVRYERRFPGWLPWTLIGVGLTGSVLGTLTEFVAASDMNNFDQRVASACAVTGCELDNPQNPNEMYLAAELNAQYDRARFRGKVAVAMLATSLPMLVTGIVMGIMNTPRAVTIDAKPTQGGATATIGWQF